MCTEIKLRNNRPTSQLRLLSLAIVCQQTESISASPVDLKNYSAKANISKLKNRVIFCHSLFSNIAVKGDHVKHYVQVFNML